VRILNHAKRAAEIDVARHELRLDDHRMPETPRGVAKLDHAEASVAIIDPEQRDPLEAKIGVDATRERVRLHAVVLNAGQ
jgi:hypothetical protein